MEIQDLKNKKIIIGKMSITCKDENGKTCGIVRNVKTWKTLPLREVFEFHKIVNASGIRAAGLSNNLIVDGKQLYYLHDLKPIEFYENYIDGKIENSSEKERYNTRKQIAEKAKEYNIIVIPCYIIKQKGAKL